MVIVINTTIIMGGGGLQVASSFLNELKEFGRDEYHIFLSMAVVSIIDQNEFPNNFVFYEFKNSPAHFKNRLSVTKKLDQLIKKIQPEFVFSVFGPTYWKPKTTHIMGFAIPHIIYSNYNFVKKLNLLSKLEFKYKEFELKRNADHYITESEDASNQLRKILNNIKQKVYTVGNTHGSHFKNINIIDGNRFSDKFSLVTISANHPHKNLNIIKGVIDELLNFNIEFLFILTIKQEDYKVQFMEYDKYIINLGPVKPAECPDIYNKVDTMFLPTLLEVFSASYPEAMKMKKPILTSYLGFARSICKDAALYFDPNNPKDIADKIFELYQNKNLQKELIEKGNERLKSFPTARQRAEKYIEICKNINNQHV